MPNRPNHFIVRVGAAYPNTTYRSELGPKAYPDHRTYLKFFNENAWVQIRIRVRILFQVDPQVDRPSTPVHPPRSRPADHVDRPAGSTHPQGHRVKML
jgi:hypothetical protein